MAFDNKDKKFLKESVTSAITENNQLLFKYMNESIGTAIAENNSILLEILEKLDLKIEDLRQESKIDKKEILGAISDFAKEVQDNREERTVQSEQINRNTRRIEKLESRFKS